MDGNHCIPRCHYSVFPLESKLLVFQDRKLLGFAWRCLIHQRAASSTASSRPCLNRTGHHSFGAPGLGVTASMRFPLIHVSRNKEAGSVNRLTSDLSLDGPPRRLAHIPLICSPSRFGNKSSQFLHFPFAQFSCAKVE